MPRTCAYGATGRPRTARIHRCRRRGTARPQLRYPKQPLVALPQRLTEVTGPVLGEDRLGPLDHDLTRQHAGEPHRRADRGARPGARRRRATRSRTRSSRCGRPTPPAATRTRGDRPSRAARPQLHRRRAVPDRRRGALPVRHHQAGRVPVAQPPPTPGGRRTSTSRCSAGRSRSGWSPRCTSPATRCSTRTRSSTRSATRPPGSAWSPRSTSTRRRRSGRWPTGSTSCCADATPPRRRTS